MALARGDRIELRGFGAFTAKHIGRNPRTGDSVSVSGKHHAFFRTSKQLRDLLNRDLVATAPDQARALPVGACRHGGGRPLLPRLKKRRPPIASNSRASITLHLTAPMMRRWWAGR